MRSGLFSYTFDPGSNAMLDKSPKKGWTSAELLKIAFKHKPNFAPGKEYQYSNTNIVLLGVVIEKLTGISASQAFEERIFRPLGMTHTELPARTNWKLPDPHARGYQFGTNVETLDSYAVPKAQQAAALDGTLPLDETDSNPSWAWTAARAAASLRESGGRGSGSGPAARSRSSPSSRRSSPRRRTPPPPRARTAAATSTDAARPPWDRAGCLGQSSILKPSFSVTW